MSSHSKGLSPFSNTIADLIKGPIQSINATSSIGSAAKKLSDNEIGSLIVTQANTPIGIVTNKDLIHRVLAVGKNPENSIEEVMTPQLISIQSNPIVLFLKG